MNVTFGNVLTVLPFSFIVMDCDTQVALIGAAAVIIAAIINKKL